MEERPTVRASWSSLFRISGWLGFAAAAPIAARLTYEQTVLTWQSGVQSVGFTVVHEYPGLLVLGVVGVLVAHVCLVVFAISVGKRILRRAEIPFFDWTESAAVLIVVALFYMPYGWWQFGTLKIAGAGHSAAEQLSYATMADQRYLVKALLSAGVPVDARGPYDRTPLDDACRAGRVELARYLNSKGADLDRAPDCRKYDEFARRMKTAVPRVPIEDNLPQVPSVTVEVH